MVASLTKIHAGASFFVICRCTDDRTNRLLGLFDEMGISAFGTVDVVPVEISRPELIEDSKDDWGVQERMAVEVIYRTVQQGNRLTFDFIAYLVIASVIAGTGLVTNSAVVVVASMLVSPLMGPIIALSLAPLIKSKSMAITALKNECIALLIALALGCLVGFLFLPFRDTYQWPTQEMKLRGDMSGLWTGILVALPSGAGVTLSITSGGVNSLVGVAISASLLPPAVNSGMTFVFALFAPFLYDNVDKAELFKEMGISFALVVVNIVCINLAAMLFFKIKAVSPIRSAVSLKKLEELSQAGPSQSSVMYHGHSTLE